MSILLAVTLAAASSVQPVCSWDHPGANPYTGKPEAAVDRYMDIPDAVRRTLKRRLAEGQSDDKVTITRDGISGKYQYDPEIHDMHFGVASVCRSVTRGKWAEARQEPAAVYCVGEHCIIVPKICGNVSRIRRQPTAETAKSDAEHAPKAAVANRQFSDKLDGRDLGLADADRPDPEATDGDDSERQAKQNGRATAEDLMHMNEPAQASTGQSGVEEFTLDGDYQIDENGRLVSMFGHRSIFSIETPHDELLLPSVTPVPEADSWAMLVAGLGLIGYVARRRRAAKAAPAAQ